MVKHCDLNTESIFIDIGAGLGKPNIHVAQVGGGWLRVRLCALHTQLSDRAHHSLCMRRTRGWLSRTASSTSTCAGNCLSTT